VSVLGAARQTGTMAVTCTGTSVARLLRPRWLLVAGIAGGEVALWEPTQGAAVTAQVYVAAADQPLTSSSDFLRVHEFHHGPHRSWH